MDFQKLVAHDDEEWEKAHPVLLEVARAVTRSFASKLSLVEMDEVAFEAVEEPFLRIGTIEPSEEKLRAYVATVALRLSNKRAGRKSLEAARNESLEQKFEESGESSAVAHDKTPLSGLEWADAIVAIRRLGEEELKLLEEFEVEGLAHAEVAEQHGWGVSSVGQRKIQARQRLWKALESNPKLLRELAFEDYPNE